MLKNILNVKWLQLVFFAGVATGAVTGALAGIALGVGAGLLVAPKSGKELQDDLAGKSNELIDDLKVRANELKNAACSFVDNKDELAKAREF